MDCIDYAQSRGLRRAGRNSADLHPRHHDSAGAKCERRVSIGVERVEVTWCWQ